MMEISFEMRKKLVGLNNKVLHCFQCGTCTASCIASRYIREFNPRVSMIGAMHGSKGTVENKTLWNCAVCHRCTERCPEGVNPSEVLLALKEYAFEQGLALPEVKQSADMIISTGRLFPLSDLVQCSRAKFGLEPLPELDTSDLKKIAELAGLAKSLSGGPEPPVGGVGPLPSGKGDVKA